MRVGFNRPVVGSRSIFSASPICSGSINFSKHSRGSWCVTVISLRRVSAVVGLTTALIDFQNGPMNQMNGKDRRGRFAASDAATCGSSGGGSPEGGLGSISFDFGPAEGGTHSECT